MESATPENPVQLSCENCKTVSDSSKKFCPQCSFPIGGTEQEKTSFRLTVSSRKRLLEDANDKIKSAKYVIIFIAAIVLVTGLIQGFSQDDFVSMIVNLVISLVFLVLAAWCAKNPFGAILSAFITYITIQLINFIFEPATLFSGIIFKIFAIGAFIKGVQSAREAQGFLAELNKMKAAPKNHE